MDKIGDGFWSCVHSVWFGAHPKPKADETTPGAVVIPPATTTTVMYMPPGTKTGVHLPHDAIPRPLPHGDTAGGGGPGASLRVVCVSDTHEGHWRLSLPPGDVLVHAGDIAICGRRFSETAARALYADFNDWISRQPFRHKFVIGGNHDMWLERMGPAEARAIITGATLLFNEQATIDHPSVGGGASYTIYGSPFSYGSSNNAAFQGRDQPEGYDERCIPADLDVDILVTHDIAAHGHIRKRVLGHTPCCRVHIGGHMHAEYGVRHHRAAPHAPEVMTVVACSMDHKYKLVNPPIVFDLPPRPSSRTAALAAVGY